MYFDLGNVLVAFDPAAPCRQMAAVLNVDPQVLSTFFTEHCFQDRLEKGEVTSAHVLAEFRRRHPGQGSFEKTNLEEIVRAGSDIFLFNAPMAGLLAKLSLAGIPLGILSNTSLPHWKFVTDGRFRVITSLFREYVLSYEHGTMKPSPSIYDAATARAAVSANAIFFTDDREENVLAARASGWQAVVFRDTHQLASELRKRGLAFNY